MDSVSGYRVPPRGGAAVRRCWLALSVWLISSGGLSADDDTPVPPLDPGTGFEGILPNPPLPPYLIADQRTSPHGVRQVFNTPETIMGQSFTPTRPDLDWVAFVFQNHTQPNTTPGPGVLRARLYADLDRSSGALDGLLAESEEVSVPSNTTAWLIFTFPRSVAVTPGTLYYCRLEWVRGYPSWVGGRLQNFYPAGGAFGYLPNPFGGPVQDLRRQQYDLVFAQGSGRGITGVTPGQLISWGLPYGLDEYGELDDPDDDKVSNLVEYFRDTNPADRTDVRKSRVHLVASNDERYLAWTVAVPAELGYLPMGGGAFGGLAGHALDRFEPGTRIGNADWGGLRLVEVVPALAEGLAPLSSFHRYRTFRLSEPVAAAPQGFILNRLSLIEGD